MAAKESLETVGFQMKLAAKPPVIPRWLCPEVIDWILSFIARIIFSLECGNDDIGKTAIFLRSVFHNLSKNLELSINTCFDSLFMMGGIITQI